VFNSKAVRILGLIAIIFSASLKQHVTEAAAEEIPLYIENSVAGIFIGKSSIGNTRALVGYGTNLKIDGKPGLCYTHPETKEFLTIIFHPKTRKAETVEISKEHTEKCKELTKGFPSFFTSKGINLGMKYKKTLPIYGKPHQLLMEQLTEDEMSFILVNHPGAYIPEDGEEGEGPFIKVDIPRELSRKDFYRAYGQPEKIVGVHKIAIYSFHTDHDKVPSVQRFYDLELHVLKRRIVKIRVHDGD
jgi:hypothetical protein